MEVLSLSVENKKEFNQVKYNNQYNKEHYTRLTAMIKKDNAETIEKYCRDIDIKKSAFAVAAMMYIINNDIPLEEFYRDGKK